MTANILNYDNMYLSWNVSSFLWMFEEDLSRTTIYLPPPKRSLKSHRNTIFEDSHTLFLLQT